ncbi:hypothetical protein Tco_1185574 [Tanacetum coccineum]
MDRSFSDVFWARNLGARLKVECLPTVVLFFPSPRFFPLGFSWEGFLRRQGWLAVYTSMLLQRDDFIALTKGAVQQGPVRARVLNDLSAEEKERYKAV